MWRSLVLCSMLFASLSSFAGKLDVMAGGFRLTAKSDTGRTASVTNLGSYRFVYRHPLLSFLEIDVGYTVNMSSVIMGDLGFGLDMGFTGYILGRSSPIKKNFGTIAALKFEEIWRPYITGGFHQRQFQSVRTSYAGFGFGAGLERAFWGDISIKSEVRYIFLEGPSTSQARELTWVAGFSLDI